MPPLHHISHSAFFILLFSLSAHFLTAKEAVVVAAEKRTRTLLVQPVILCDDDGKNPARHALPKKLVNAAYTKADLEFLYLDPIRWNHGKARRGEVNLDTIVADGHAQGIITRDPRVCTLLFVSAVDGKKDPLGRGMQNGNICFVSLGSEGEMKDPAERAFVVAHEIGHCLNLRHTVDDPAVPDDIPNLQGSGPYAERLAPAALHPTQVKTILASPLALPRRHFNSAKESARLVAHDHWDNPCSNLSESTVRFYLNMEPDEKVPEAQASRTTFVRKGFTEYAVDFSEDDVAFLNKMINRIEEKLNGEWPLLTRLPWNFVKMKPSFCSGFPHTRGLSIVLTDRFFNVARIDENHAMEVLLHEKLHVIQRLFPERFKEHYREYGFIPVKLPSNTMQRLNLICNPDAPIPEWAIRVDGKPMLLATTLKMRNGQPRMAPVMHPLQPTTGKPFTHTPEAAVEDIPGVIRWKSRFPIMNGHDDPREVIAYLLMHIYRTDFLKQKAQGVSTEAHQNLLGQERKVLPQLLALPKGLE